MVAASDLWLKAVATADFIFARVFLGRFHGTNVRREEGTVKRSGRRIEFERQTGEKRGEYKIPVGVYKLIIPPLDFSNWLVSI